MKENLKLKIKDSRVLFKNVKKSEKYYLFIEYGSSFFYFSNKKKADRWLSRFKKESTGVYNELGDYISYLFELSICCIPISDYVSLTKNRNSLNFISDRFTKVKTNFVGGNIEIGREINLIYNAVSLQLDFYHSILRTSNRYRYKYNELIREKKKLQRLSKDISLLLTDADGINKLTNNSVTKDIIKYENYLRIA